MHGLLEENETLEEIILFPNNDLITFNKNISHILSDEEYNNNCCIDENNKKKETIPTSNDRIKIEFKNSEEMPTNSKTLLIPKFYSLDEIINILDNSCNNNKIINTINEGRSIETSGEYEFMSTLNKKRKRDENENILFDEEIIKDEKNGKYRGRKTENRPIKRHDKMAADNIIKKIKAKLFEYNLQFINLLLKKMNLKVKLFKLDYIYIDQLKREKEFQLFKSLLKDIYSLNVSPKYSQKGTDNNRRVIEALIKSEKKLNNRKNFYYDTLMFILNMTFRGWFDVFTGKNTFENLIKDYTGDQSKINIELIKESFVGLNILLNDLLNDNKIDNKYFACFVFYLYNYERWFFIKQPRNRKKEKK